MVDFHVLYSGQRFVNLAHRIVLSGFHTDVALDVNIGAHMGKDSGLGGLDHTLDEGVGGFLKCERETHAVAVDAYVVIQHTHIHDIFSSSRIAYRAQGIND